MNFQQQGEDQWTQDALKELAAQKEQEWRQVQQLRSEALEAALKEKEKTLHEERAKFMKLKEDFKYNLHLLSERDAELEKYDSVFNALKSQLLQKDGQISELKIKVDSMTSAIEQESKLREELQSHYQQRIREKQAEIDKYRCDKDAEIQKERNELETFKRKLERQLHELEEELEIQRRELQAEYEDVLRKREHEYRLKIDEMSGTVMAHEMKVKLLSKELEMLKSSQEQTAKEFATVEGYQQELEKQVKQKQWEIEDLKAMHSVRISEFKNKVHHLETALKKAEQEYTRKYAEFDRELKEREATIKKLQQNYQDREHQLQEQVRSLQAQVEDAQLKLRQAEWKVLDSKKEKDSIVKRLTSELNELKSRWELQLSDMSKSNVHRDVELEALREQVGQLQIELSERKMDIERYKHELAQALQREHDLEQAKTQLDLDWQRRYESVEREQYEKAEHLIKKLTEARDEALSELKEKERELEHKQKLTELLTKERDLALATLKKHGLSIDRNVDLTKWQKGAETESEHVAMLEEQNEHLRQVIRQMREEMERLGDALPEKLTSDGAKFGAKLVANEYVKNLEEELHRVKARCRQLEQQMKDFSMESKVNNELQAKAVEAGGDNMLIKSHIEELNNTIGSLRSDKVELMTQLRKQQARLQHLETALEEATKQPRTLQAKIQQLEYEVSAQTRRYEAETSGLKARISELELQLAETRKEADEYHKANVDQNLEITELRNQLSKMKVSLAEERPTVNFGAQELMIQQLQDEIRRLRQMQRGEESIADVLTFEPKLGHGHGLTTNAVVAQLQQKLQAAAKHIRQLTKERHQLIEIGNRLRAELKNNARQMPSAPKCGPAEPTIQPQSRRPTSGSLLQQKIQNKLQQLEQLQYEITKQELTRNKPKQSAQSFQSTKPESSDAASDDESSNQKNYIHNKPFGSMTKSSSGSENNLQPSRPMTAPDVVMTRSTASYADYVAASQRTSSLTQEPTASGLLASISSVGGGESIQEIWRMLDEEGASHQNTFTPPGESGPFQGLIFPGDQPRSRPKSAEALVLQGEKPVMEPKTPKKTELKKLSYKASGKVGAVKTTGKPKIRNYNVKDQ